MSVELKTMTADAILRLNKTQTAGRVHPFTCPNRGDGEHRTFNGDLGALVATRRGWICPWCDYTQTWAHGFMATDAASEPFKWPSISPTPTGVGLALDPGETLDPEDFPEEARNG